MIAMLSFVQFNANPQLESRSRPKSEDTCYVYGKKREGKHPPKRFSPNSSFDPNVR
jgi:hypothetical protein